MGLGLNLANVTRGQDDEEETKVGREAAGQLASQSKPDMQMNVAGTTRPRGVPPMNLGMVPRSQPDAEM